MTLFSVMIWSTYECGMGRGPMKRLTEQCAGSGGGDRLVGARECEVVAAVARSLEKYSHVFEQYKDDLSELLLSTAEHTRCLPESMTENAMHAQLKSWPSFRRLRCAAHASFTHTIMRLVESPLPPLACQFSQPALLSPQAVEQEATRGLMYRRLSGVPT